MIRPERITEQFLSLAKIDSPSFGERNMADRLTEELKKLGIAAEEDGAAAKTHGTAGNLYAFLPGGRGSPLLFSGHMDTVKPALGKKPQLQPDGTITSDGTTVLGADDLSGVTVIIEALTSILEDGLPHRPREILFTIAEEPYDCGSEVFDFGKIRSKEAYVLDLNGAAGGAAYAAPSICSFTAELFGKTSHAGFAPEKGIHAVAAAARAVDRLKMGYLDGETTLNVGTIQGGAAANIVPVHCSVGGELRSYSHAKAKKLLEEVTNTFSQAADSFGATCRVTSRFGCRAYEMPLEDPVARRYGAACEKAGIHADFFRTFGGSDANQFWQHGIRSLVIASAMFQSHTCKEYTSVSDMTKIAEIVQELMLGAEESGQNCP